MMHWAVSILAVLISEEISLGFGESSSSYSRRSQSKEEDVRKFHARKQRENVS